MKILVIGGMHGNEPLGLEVVRMFKKRPAPDVDTVIANEEAVRLNARFKEQDLNRSFPGDKLSEDYETRRAAELMELAKKYDLVLDFHNTNCPDNDCGFVGESAPEQLYKAAWTLGLKRMVVADYDCINKYATNCLSIEVSLASPLCDARLWYERIALLARLDGFDTTPEMEMFRFVYRITLEDRERLQLEAKDLAAFRPIDSTLASELGVVSPAFPIFIGDSYTPYNYGGLLNRISTDGGLK